MPVERRARVRAFAKINLTLRVLGLRPDGYHELRAIFQSLALHDTLTFRIAPGAFRIHCDDRLCPTDRTNLVWRAALCVWRAAGRRGVPRNVAVHIAKRIPLQAGLGGGSSDAAAAIRGLTALWRIDLPRDRQYTIAAELGADVPFFLEGGTALGVERGDRLFPLIDLPSAWTTLVVPGFGVGTADAYGWWDRSRGCAGGRARAAVLRAWLPVAELRNDLEQPVARRHPEIARLVGTLRRRGATYAAMSGSGSAVFGLFDRRGGAEAAASALAGHGRRTLVTRTLNRATYTRLARSQGA